MEKLRSNPEESLLHPLEKWHSHQEEVSYELSELAAGHAKRSNGLLTTLPINPEVYEAQKITKPYIDSQPANLEDIIATASLAETNYPKMLNSLLADEEETSSISHIGEDLAAGQNIILVTNHGKIQDIAIVLATYDTAIKKTSEKNNRNYEFSNNILLSKMIAHLGFQNMPAVDILGLMCDRQYFSFPKTDSIKNSNISSKLVDAYNSSLRGLIRHRLNAGGNLFAIAPSGTIDKPLDPNHPEQINLASVGSGTVKLLTSPHTKVLPVATWLDGENPVFEPLGIPRSLKTNDSEQDKQEVDEMMTSLASVLSKTVPDKTFTYNQK